MLGTELCIIRAFSSTNVSFAIKGRRNAPTYPARINAAARGRARSTATSKILRKASFPAIALNCAFFGTLKTGTRSALGQLIRVNSNG